ncbi:Plant mobile domain protein family [Raphanus sativus]|nr:Plant mobile domain protein family [Raphanus sativus]
MVLPPSGNSRPSEKTHLLKPCFTTSTEANKLPRQSLKALSLSVSFNGWRSPNVKFKSWATKMLSLHEPTWKKAGILQAVAVSTIKIIKDSNLVMGVAERWCPDTKTFLFPWGEATVTLEDVMVLLGFSVLGSSVFAPLDGSGEETVRELKKEWVKIKKDNNVSFVTQVTWMRRFMGTGDDELEHAAFLALWLSYFVLPTRYCHVDKAVLPIAVHLSRGNRIALAPPVLAHLYADLTLLKDHTRDFSFDEIDLSALFKLVQVWTWERLKELQPTPNLLAKGEPRLALWDNVGQGDNKDVREILHKSKMDSFEWRPYTKTLKNWLLPKFYPDREMWVSVGPDLDEEFISFARCIKVSDLVGIHSVEHYFPNRVASQFGLLQDVPCPPLNRNKLSKEAAWDEYDKPIDGLTLFIPSRSATPRVTPTFQRSLKEKGVVESRNIIGGDYDGTSSASGSRKRTRRERACTMDHCQAHESDEENLSLTIAQLRRLSIKKCSDVTYGGEDASEPLGKKSRFEADNNDSGPHQVLGLIRADENETVPPPPEIEQRNDGNDETGSRTGRNMVDENNSSDPPVGSDDDILVSPTLEKRQTCDDELDVHGNNVEKMTMPDDGNKEPECLLHEDGGTAEEKASSEKKEDDSMIQTKIASNADDNEPSPCQNLATGGSELIPESNSGSAVGDETQGHDCLFHDTVLGSEETMKSSDELENVGGSDSYEKRIHNVKVLALSIEERIIKAQRNVAWLKARKATKHRGAAAARLI